MIIPLCAFFPLFLDTKCLLCCSGKLNQHPNPRLYAEVGASKYPSRLLLSFDQNRKDKRPRIQPQKKIHCLICLASLAVISYISKTGFPNFVSGFKICFVGDIYLIYLAQQHQPQQIYSRKFNIFFQKHTILQNREQHVEINFGQTP